MYQGKKSKWSKKTKFLKEFFSKEYGQDARGASQTCQSMQIIKNIYGLWDKFDKFQDNPKCLYKGGEDDRGTLF